ncbi:hypothetical protein UCDDA912_g05946 [Diaporthe ampelina]|uniref:Uncharacterized protein n=1 Tax=Diaporthe ampelina TaxID=1214573 RepID=A0A0G2FJ24_9PEZI|nr:hypothetical protein UCDDA912_g05946 [Diaporthe ampelina]
MTFLKAPLILVAMMVLRSVDAACVEDNCYRAMYFNPAGAEECSAHFITTVIPPATTTTLTITSGIAPVTTISGPVVDANTIAPSEAIPTYIVRACYGDVQYRFESACSCIGVGPTVATAPQPVATNTVIVPSAVAAATSTRPVTTPPPVNLPEPIDLGPGAQPACVAVPLGPVVVTVQVDEVFAMLLTVSGPILCLAETAPTPPQSSQCNCASTLPASAPFSSSFTESAVSNATSSSSPDAFSTVFRTVYTSTSSSEGFSDYSSTAESTAATGPVIYIRITEGAFIGQFIESDEPDETVNTNLKSHTTTELGDAAVWTLDAETGILFQEIGGAWWGAYFTFGVRSQWSSVLLLPADTVVSWLTAPVLQREPLKCVIDYSANMLLTCGTHGWTQLTESDKCGWAITTPLNPFHALACPNAQELLLQAIEVNPEDEGISKKK